jgi:putative phosphoesterase
MRLVTRRVATPRRIGLVSDTHGLVRPEALTALAGCDLLLHAGDVGGAEVLQAFAAIAPLIAVRGNNDHGDWAASLPERCAIEWPGARVLLVHDRNSVDADSVRGFDTVVAGHSHRPGAERRQGIFEVNPGSAGPRRFSLPVAVGYLEVRAAGLEATIVELTITSGGAAAKQRLTNRRP